MKKIIAGLSLLWAYSAVAQESKWSQYQEFDMPTITCQTVYPIRCPKYEGSAESVTIPNFDSIKCDDDEQIIDIKIDKTGRSITITCAKNVKEEFSK